MRNNAVDGHLRRLARLQLPARVTGRDTAAALLTALQAEEAALLRRDGTPTPAELADLAMRRAAVWVQLAITDDTCQGAALAAVAAWRSVESWPADRLLPRADRRRTVALRHTTGTHT